MRVLFAGGGTGGHLYPALAVAAELRARDPEGAVAFMGTPERIEAKLVPEAGYPFYPVSVVGMPRKLGPELLRFFGALGDAVGKARRVLREFRPQVVVGTGGYVSAPAVVAAALEGIPVLLCEQNVFPGLANRVLARFAKQVATTFPESNRYFGGKALCLGNPIREEVYGLDMAAGREVTGYPPTEHLLLVTGGSLGARAINQAVVNALPELLVHGSWSILHVAGPKEYAALDEATRDAQATGRYRLEPYLDRMPAAIAASDLVLSRAGATTVAELTAAGKAMILVPFEHGGRDQPANARALAAEGAAIALFEADLAHLAEVVGGLMDEPEARMRMSQASRRRGRPEAARLVADRVEAIARLPQPRPTL